MSIDPGKFQLYERIDPPLKAGDYRFTTSQALSGTSDNQATDADLPIDQLQTHVRVRSPQYILPPDQVLSTFPPAGSTGSYGVRLPQIVIKRRTLPWERELGSNLPPLAASQQPEPQPDDTLPWLALVLIAEGEAELVTNAAVAECVTPGVEMDVPHDVELGNYLKIRQSMVHNLFPTRNELGLLAHAREVDINDTELMMGDDDGFLAVVISNRLPLAGVDEEGNEVPVKYLACLVNLCHQWRTLPDDEPQDLIFTLFPQVFAQVGTQLAAVDHIAMGSANPPSMSFSQALSLPKDTAPKDAKAFEPLQTKIQSASLDAGAAPYEAAKTWQTQTNTSALSDVYAGMAAPFSNAVASGFVVGQEILFDPEVRYPVLLHWSFTSTGDDTFKSLMNGLDSGLFGTVGNHPDNQGRPPLEVVETGHVGLDQETRRGDEMRCWYRGPLLAHPPADGPEGRLPLANTADQIRVVVPDGREDISLASAFEIGRLLALSRPSMVAALMRWRQQGYQVAQTAATFTGATELQGELDRLNLSVDRAVGGMLGAFVASSIVAEPETVLGDPRPLVTAGRPVFEDISINAVLATGLGIDQALLDGSAMAVSGGLQVAPVPAPPVTGLPTDVGSLRSSLGPKLSAAFTRTAVQSLAPDIASGQIEVAALPPDLQTQIGIAAGLEVRPGVAVTKGNAELDRLVRDGLPAPDAEEGDR